MSLRKEHEALGRSYDKLQAAYLRKTEERDLLKVSLKREKDTNAELTTGLLAVADKLERQMLPHLANTLRSLVEDTNHVERDRT